MPAPAAGDRVRFVRAPLDNERGRPDGTGRQSRQATVQARTIVQMLARPHTFIMPADEAGVWYRWEGYLEHFQGAPQ